MFWIILGAATTVIGLTICLSFMSSSAHSVTIFAKTETTIFLLNIDSTISVFLITELLSGACESLRWTLASGSSGIGMATFLVLGKATGSFGVLRLLFSNQNVGHRKWCGQRFLHCISLTDFRVAQTVFTFILSFILSGALKDVMYIDTPFNPLVYNLDKRNEATIFVAVNRTAYQLEYFPPAPTSIFNFSTDCTIVGSKDVIALAVCIKNVGDDLVAGN